MYFKGAHCKLTLLTHLVKQVLILSALLFLITMLVVGNRGVGSRTQQEYIQDEITLRVQISPKFIFHRWERLSPLEMSISWLIRENLCL
jgi:hypothetical protein